MVTRSLRRGGRKHYKPLLVSNFRHSDHSSFRVIQLQDTNSHSQELCVDTSTSRAIRSVLRHIQPPPHPCPSTRCDLSHYIRVPRHDLSHYIRIPRHGLSHYIRVTINITTMVTTPRGEKPSLSTTSVTVTIHHSVSHHHGNYAAGDTTAVHNFRHSSVSQFPFIIPCHTQEFSVSTSPLVCISLTLRKHSQQLTC